MLQLCVRHADAPARQAGESETQNEVASACCRLPALKARRAPLSTLRRPASGKGFRGR